MPGFQDAPLIGPGSELQLTIDGRAVPHVEIVEALAETPPSRRQRGGGEDELAVGAPAAAELALDQRNLFGEAERIAARAASPATRKQYAAIFRAFGDWLGTELGRPPVVGDLSTDAIAAYARHLELRGGRGGRPAALATRRVYLSMLRALARDLGRHEHADRVRVPQHAPAPPETLADVDYQNLLRVPDRRSVIGKRDYALLRLLGDCGLRSAELRGLTAGDVRRPRRNARHHRLRIRGKGGREREVPIPAATQDALEAWLVVHPLARGRAGLRDDEPLVVRLGRHPGAEEPGPIAAQSVHKLVRKACLAAGVPAALAHPHALRSFWATTLLEDGVPVHRVQARLGHADMRTTGRYAAEDPGQADDVAEVLDRHHQTARRRRG